MRELGKKYWDIGTNSKINLQRYIENCNYCDKFSQISILQNKEFQINKIDSFFIRTSKGNKISSSLARQMLTCWEALGFIIKQDENSYIKIIDSNLTDDQLYSIAAANLFVPSNKKEINSYRDMVIYNCLSLLYSGLDIANIFKLKTLKTDEPIDNKIIVEASGKKESFEREILKNKFFERVVKLYYESINE